MRPGRTPMPTHTLTRRALGTRFAGAAAAIGFGQGASASGATNPIALLDPDLRDAALRGLAIAAIRSQRRQRTPHWRGWRKPIPRQDC